MSLRSGNLVLNTALVLLLGVAAVLVYAFSQRIVSPRPDPQRLENPGNLIGDYIQLEVMNGAGIDGLAGEMGEYLQDLGFDVLKVGNYSKSDVAKTVVIDQIGNPDAAEQIALALGVGNDRIEVDLQPTWFLDATVVIGRDYATMKPFVDRLTSQSVDDDEEDDAESSESD